MKPIIWPDIVERKNYAGIFRQKPEMIQEVRNYPCIAFPHESENGDLL